MKIVIISNFTTREWVVVQEVLKQFNDVVLVRMSSKKNSSAPKKLDLNYHGLKIYRKIHKKRLAKILKTSFYPDLKYKEVIIENKSLNSPEGVELITSLSPDVILTCRSPILHSSIFSIPKKCAINVHYGIPPHYRGNDTNFWAFMNRDYDKIGGSVHFINEGVDTGNILAEVYPIISPTDDEITIDSKTTMLLADTVTKVLKHLESIETIPEGKIQDAAGKNYKNRDRTIRHTLKYYKKIFFKKPIVVDLPQREKFYF